jgi:hypothetical protein
MPHGKGCPHLNGGNWTRHTSPDATQAGKVRAYGRLSVDPNNDLAFDLLQDDDQPMAFGYVYANPADARGLVAAWNACEGIPTEALEAGVVADMLEALRTMTALCKLKYGNLDADVWAEIQRAEAIAAKATEGKG